MIKENKITYYPSLILGILALTLIFLMNASTASRYFFQTSIVWSEEILKIIFLWSIFLGVALTSYDDNLIGLTILRDKLSVSRWHKPYHLFYYGTILSFSLFFSYEILQMVIQQKIYGEENAVLGLPAYIISLGILICSALWNTYCFFSIRNLFRKNR